MRRYWVGLLSVLGLGALPAHTLAAEGAPAAPVGKAEKTTAKSNKLPLDQQSLRQQNRPADGSENAITKGRGGSDKALTKGNRAITKGNQTTSPARTAPGKSTLTKSQQ